MPDGLDLSGLNSEFHDYAFFFVSLLIRKRITDARLKYIEYIPLYKRFLQDFVPWHDLQTTLAYLMDTGQVECDGVYYKGTDTTKGKSFGYKLSEILERSNVTMRHAQNATLRRKLAKAKKEGKEQKLPVHQHLRLWLEKVEIDAVAARIAIDELHGQPADVLQRWKNGRHYSTEERLSMRKLFAQAAVVDLEDTFCRYYVDEYGRAHTNISNLPGCLRKFLSVGGKPLVSLDIRNSQPLMLSVLIATQAQSVLTSVCPRKFGHHLLSRESLHGLTCLNDLRMDVSPLQHKDLELFGSDLQDYKTACEQGTFYESMAGTELDDDHARSAFKEAFYEEVLFGTNKRMSRQAKAFAAKYPTVWHNVQKIKKKDYRHLAHNLQRIESSIVFSICERLRLTRPDIPLVTIHDSILTTEDHVETVRQSILDEFGSIGFRPSLKQETYA